MVLKNFLGYELIKGLIVTLKYFFKSKVTIEYPEVLTPKSSRFRGLHALMRDKAGEELCIACKLCEAACPALAITIESHEREDGTRRTTRYDIDLFKCVYCGFCEEACPVDAIVLSPISNFYLDNAQDSIVDKQVLLSIGDKYRETILKAKAEDEKYR